MKNMRYNQKGAIPSVLGFLSFNLDAVYIY